MIWGKIKIGCLSDRVLSTRSDFPVFTLFCIFFAGLIVQWGKTPLPKTLKNFFIFFKNLLTNRSACVIIISERERKKEVNNNDTWNNIYFRRNWTCTCRSNRLVGCTSRKLRESRKALLSQT
jgi:hypothetical protein